MGTVFEALAIFAGVAIFCFLGAIVGAAGGAFGGWCIQNTFVSDFVLQGARSLGFEWHPADLPAIGALLGFAGGFLHTTVRVAKD